MNVLTGQGRRPRPRRAIPGAAGGRTRTSRRALGACAASLALALAATGCVTVHGETALVPTATKSEAAQAVKEFTAAYNTAAHDLDPARDADVLAGPFGAITQDALRGRHAQDPDSGRGTVPLKLSDVRYLIPQQRGWPRWFVADTDTNRDVDKDPAKDTRWFFVFTRSGPGEGWRASYLSILTPDEIPAFRFDEDGHVRSAPPGRLSQQYTRYLQDGKGDRFAPGQHTTRWRAERARSTDRPGWSTQYADEAAATGAYRPRALRTKDGGALVFFASRHYERHTAAEGIPVTVPAAAKPLLKGEVKRSYTLEYTSNEAVLTPPSGQVTFLNRLQGLTGAEGG